MQVFGKIRAGLRWCLAVLMALALVAVGSGEHRALGQSLFGIADPSSPFVLLPGIQGEFQTTLIVAGISQGVNSIPELGLTWGLRDGFGMNRDTLFMDVRLRATAGRFFAEAWYEQREIVGLRGFQGRAGEKGCRAILDYSGIRVGGGVDIFVGYGARVGADFDVDLYRPIFTECTWTRGGKKMIGASPLTLGAHLWYNPQSNWYGLTPIVDARARWSVQGANVFDWEVAGGLKAPETVLGSWAIKFGYRSTSIKFEDSQVYNNTSVRTQFDGTIAGWFGSLTYLY